MAAQASPLPVPSNAGAHAQPIMKIGPNGERYPL
ncbi:hypothetical protein BGCPKDLD_4496 [Methylorubrum suomiense]|uniref:Uncharacterized protein n=1 Tax=Methylorubrum suomiense TaxID=144191 RepID=A0ABQ4V2H8_9HYPH|nr:hypothetical protein BGCPKDLD_4496 [Methylorubrum suomiense]